MDFPQARVRARRVRRQRRGRPRRDRRDDTDVRRDGRRAPSLGPGLVFPFVGHPRAVTHAPESVSYTHLRAHETPEHLVCRLLLEKKKNKRIDKWSKRTFN